MVTASIDSNCVSQTQATLRRRILRAFVGWGLLGSFEANEMPAYQHSGFSVDTDVCIEVHDRAALERLLRCCARPAFAMDRLCKEGSDLVYRCAKQRSEPICFIQTVLLTLVAEKSGAGQQRKRLLTTGSDTAVQF